MEWRIRGDDMVARVTVLMLNNERCLQRDSNHFFPATSSRGSFRTYKRKLSGMQSNQELVESGETWKLGLLKQSFKL